MSFDIKSHLILNYISSCCSGYIVDNVLYAFDTVKVRLQTAEFNRSTLYNHVFKGIYINNLMIFSNGNYFLGYELFKYISLTKLNLSDNLSTTIGSIFAEIFYCTTRCPLEIIKTNIQLDKQLTLKGKSLKEYFNGNLSFIIRNIPYSIIQLNTYEYLKKIFKKHNYSNNDKYNINELQSIVIGFTSSLLPAIITYPFDVIKTKKMSSNLAYNDLILHYFNNENIKTIYKGFSYRLIYCCSYGIIFIYFYEKIKNNLRQYL